MPSSRTPRLHITLGSQRIIDNDLQVASEVKLARTPVTGRLHMRNPATLQTPKSKIPSDPMRSMGSVRWFVRLTETVPGLLDDHTAPTNNNWSCSTRWVLAGSIETRSLPFDWCLLLHFP